MTELETAIVAARHEVAANDDCPDVIPNLISKAERTLALLRAITVHYTEVTSDLEDRARSLRPKMGVEQAD